MAGRRQIRLLVAVLGAGAVAILGAAAVGTAAPTSVTVVLSAQSATEPVGHGVRLTAKAHGALECLGKNAATLRALADYLLAREY